jgi:hypothetical protein
MPRQPSSLKELLEAALPGALARRLPAPGLLRAWRDAAGPALARRALPVALEEGGMLVVAVSGSAWRQELSLAGPQLCARLQEAGFAVQRLKLVNASTPAAPPPPAAPLPELSPAEEAELMAGLAEIKDPALREALASLGRASLRARKAADK